MQLGPVRLANVDRTPGSGVPGCLVLLPVLREVAHLVVRTIAMDDLLGPLLSVYPLSRDAAFRSARCRRTAGSGWSSAPPWCCVPTGW